VSDAGNPLTNGDFGSWATSFAFNAAGTSHDNATADSARGAVRVAAVGSKAKILYTETLGGGWVVYWNGNEDLADWDSTTYPDMAAMVANAVQHMNQGCGGSLLGGDCDDTNATLYPGTCP
jgi:hypothetical protein